MWYKHTRLQRFCQLLHLTITFVCVNLHCLHAGAESDIFILDDIVLNLQISLVVLELFRLNLPEDRRLIRLSCHRGGGVCIGNAFLRLGGTGASGHTGS